MGTKYKRRGIPTSCFIIIDTSVKYFTILSRLDVFSNSRVINKSFNLENSLKRIDSILTDSTSYEESDDIPDIDDLTFTNGNT